MSEKLTVTEKIYWIHAVSPIHVGSGRGVGHIDLPIVREKVTNWPFIPGSAVKGVVAASFEATDEARKNKADLRAAFGMSDSENSGAESNAGSLVFSDARILCLPIKSFRGTFAWISSALSLKRFSSAASFSLDIPSLVSQSKITLTKDSVLSKQSDKKVFLDELDFDVNQDNSSCADKIADKIAKAVFAGDNAWQDVFKKRFAIVHDDVFSFFAKTGTEVAARIRIKPDNKIVEDGALWYEESLPVETILAGTVWCDKIFTVDNKETGYKGTKKNLMDLFCKNNDHLQIGGKASVGKGMARLVFTEKAV